MTNTSTNTTNAETAAGEVLERLDRTFEARVDEPARIPSVSASGFCRDELRHSADAVASLLSDSGFETVEVLTLGEAHPYVVGEWLGAGADAPTLLLYAHRDVQPPGRDTAWRSPAFEPTRVESEGEAGRLYGRGVVDDKAGIVVFAGALRAWLENGTPPPGNLKIVVEGEEEIGSGHLADFLRAHHARLQADVIAPTAAARGRCSSTRSPPAESSSIRIVPWAPYGLLRRAPGSRNTACVLLILRFRPPPVNRSLR